MNALSQPADDARRLAMVAVDRAASEVRRGRAVAITAAAGQPTVLALAAETITADALAALKQFGPVHLALTLHRANVLHVRSAGTSPVLLPASDRLTAEILRDLADPTTDLDHPLLGPFVALMTEPPAAAAGAILLCKRARLLPSAVLVAVPAAQAAAWVAREQALSVPLAALQDYEAAAAGTLRQVIAAKVPLVDAENTRIIAFRPADGALEHLAIIIGDPPRAEPVLTRLHSECFTGDLLGSLRCDCGEQLRGAIAQMRDAGAGLLLYLAQEGRGIGLINKLRAYRLQDQGFDTVDANIRLGFEADERLFQPAAEMLRSLGFSAVRLLTNNPEKVTGLTRCGITVTERVPHAFPANSHNEAYLATKKKRSGHYL